MTDELIKEFLPYVDTFTHGFDVNIAGNSYGIPDEKWLNIWNDHHVHLSDREWLIKWGGPIRGGKDDGWDFLELDDEPRWLVQSPLTEWSNAAQAYRPRTDWIKVAFGEAAPVRLMKHLKLALGKFEESLDFTESYVIEFKDESRYIWDANWDSDSVYDEAEPDSKGKAGAAARFKDLNLNDEDLKDFLKAWEARKK